MADTSKFDCSICYSLLVDPVVGRCGHAFCKACLREWQRSQATIGRPCCCPMCRAVLSADAGEGLGVCIHLKDAIEALFPDQAAERRQEVQQQQQQQQLAHRSSGGAHRSAHSSSREAAQAAARTIRRTREGRQRYIRVRRTRQPIVDGGAAVGADGNAAVSTAPFAPLGAFSPVSQPEPQQQQHPARGPWATGSGSLQLRVSLLGAPDASFGGEPGHGSAVVTGRFEWAPPSEVSFTMGWYDPHKEGRKLRGGRCRRAVRR